MGTAPHCDRAIGIRLGTWLQGGFLSAKGGLYSEWITEVPKLRPLVFLRVGLGMDGAGRGFSRQVKEHELARRIALAMDRGKRMRRGCR